MELLRAMIITLLSLISGGIVVNSMITELPRDKTGKFLSFLFGGVFYSILLLAL